jgi:HD-like signal output (HDOD) protein
MPFLLIAILILAGVFIAIALVPTRRPKQASSKSPASIPQAQPKSVVGAEAAAAAVPYSSELIENVVADCFKLAFDVPRFDHKISGEHAAVLESVARSVDDSVHQRDYFPRRPMLLPKLLQALNDSETTRQDLVRLILEDPTLAGNVLQRANSSFYRVSPEPVENIDRAVVFLGTEGLRGLMAAAILQPVFRVPRGSFEKFATVTWEQAERTAVAADPFVAQLMGLLSMLANIVLFRLTMDKYKDQPNILPRAEVFIAAIQAHRGRLTGLIAANWELTDMSLKALQEQEQRTPPSQMSELGRCVYFGELCGALATLAVRDLRSAEDAQSILQAQGLDPQTSLALWNAATAAKNGD